MGKMTNSRAAVYGAFFCGRIIFSPTVSPWFLSIRSRTRTPGLFIIHYSFGEAVASPTFCRLDNTRALC